MQIPKWSQSAFLEMLKLHKHNPKAQVPVSDLMVIMNKHATKDLRFSKSSTVDLLLLDSVCGIELRGIWKYLFYYF